MNEQTTTLTKRDLVEQNFGALDISRVGAVKVTPTAGGIAFASALEVMDFAKLMAMSDKAVPKDFRGNAGMCLAITMQAIEWRMSPFQVANKAYAVNDRIGFEAQLIHAIIEARGPLKERLNCEYEGDGLTRKCKVIGKFLDGSERFYESPMLKDIKVKNSPLWTADPDQQLWYYSSRAWARKWCPDVILGVYSKEEIEDGVDTREPALPGLSSRLVNGNVNRDEGHKDGYAETELDQVAAARHTNPDAPHQATEETINEITPETLVTDKRIGLSAGALKFCETNAIPTLAGILMLSEAEIAAAKGMKKTTVANIKEIVEKHGFKLREEAKPVEIEAKAQEPDKAAKVWATPKNPEQWKIYCMAWLDAYTDADQIKGRWRNEMALRNDCGVTSEVRAPVEEYKTKRIAELENAGG